MLAEVPISDNPDPLRLIRQVRILDCTREPTRVVPAPQVKQPGLSVDAWKVAFR
jgi:hypothetical protein